MGFVPGYMGPIFLVLGFTFGYMGSWGWDPTLEQLKATGLQWPVVDLRSSAQESLSALPAVARDWTSKVCDLQFHNHFANQQEKAKQRSLKKTNPAKKTLKNSSKIVSCIAQGPTIYKLSIQGTHGYLVNTQSFSKSVFWNEKSKRMETAILPSVAMLLDTGACMDHWSGPAWSLLYSYDKWW